MSVRHKLPASSRLAAALLDVLGSSGEIAARARALRAIGGEGGALRLPGAWIAEGRLLEMYRSVPVDRALGRRIGHALVAPSGIGFSLSYAGVATIEKAYRRVDHLLARESESGEYQTAELNELDARIEYRAPDPAHLDPAYCGVRAGMLEALPLSFGLLPARVKEVACIHEGAAACAYEVRWSRSSWQGAMIGAVGGLVSGAALGAFIPFIAGASYGPMTVGALVGGILMTALAACAGHALDLSRQLQAVAGARRGQLALLDQADRELAERMDQLAKLDSGVESAMDAEVVASRRRFGARSSSVPARDGGEVRESGALDRADAADGADERDERPGDTELADAVQGSARRISDAVAVVQRGLADLHRKLVRSEREDWTEDEIAGLLAECVAESRSIEAEGTRLAGSLDPTSRRRAPHDLSAIVTAAVDSLRPTLNEAQELDVELEADLPPVGCVPYQIEQVVLQLGRNAIEATQTTQTGGHVRFALAATPAGVELVVDDDGCGIEEEILDQLFDPFMAPAVAGVDGGFGLPVCYRIIDDHGGELRVASEVGDGTRVTVLLPVASVAASAESSPDPQSEVAEPDPES